VGQGRLWILIIARPQKNWTKPESERAKRKGGLGVGKRFRNFALAECRQAGGNAGRVNQQNPLDFAGKRF